MKKPVSSRSTTIILIESFVWIILTFLARLLLEQAAARWQVGEPWLFLLKIGAVLGLIALALFLHGVVFRWLARRGILPPERQD
jgi:hypothetical protein